MSAWAEGSKRSECGASKRSEPGSPFSRPKSVTTIKRMATQMLPLPKKKKDSTQARMRNRLKSVVGYKFEDDRVSFNHGGVSEPQLLQLQAANRARPAQRSLWERLDALVIHPGNPKKSMFDVFVAGAIVTSSISTPLNLAFEVSVLGNGTEIFLDVVFIFDVALQFFNGYKERGYPVMSMRMIAVRYLRTWFLFDFIASVPWDRMVDQLSAVALIKTIRLVRVRRLMSGLSVFAGGNIIRVFVIIFFWLLVSHVSACLFFLVGWQTCERWYNETWVTTYWPQIADECLNHVSPADLHYSPQPVRLTQIYIRSLYWSLATMSALGYGNGPAAVTDIEYLYSIFNQLIGACLSAAIFSNVAQMINKQDATSRRYSEQTERINEFVRFSQLPPDLVQRLVGYNDFLFAVNHGFDVNSLAKVFPPNLRGEVFYQMHQKLVRQVPMFKECDDNFIRAIVQILQPQVLLKGDVTYRRYITLHDVTYRRYRTLHDVTYRYCRCCSRATSASRCTRLLERCTSSTAASCRWSTKKAPSSSPRCARAPSSAKSPCSRRSGAPRRRAR